MSKEPAKPRAHDIRLPFEGETGKYNAFTDVSAVKVGFTPLDHNRLKQIMGRFGRLKNTKE